MQTKNLNGRKAGKEIKMKALNDEMMEKVSGGMTRNMQAAFDVINGKYGTDQYRVNALTAAGYNASVVQGLVNDWLKYGNVAMDVMNGKYGVGADRMNRLTASGYNANTIQNLVNQYLM